MNITSLASPFMDDTFEYIFGEITPYISEYFKSFEYTPWIFSILGSIIIGLSGILPLLIIPDTTNDKDAATSNREF